MDTKAFIDDIKKDLDSEFDKISTSAVILTNDVSQPDEREDSLAWVAESSPQNLCEKVQVSGSHKNSVEEPKVTDSLSESIKRACRHFLEDLLTEQDTTLASIRSEWKAKLKVRMISDLRKLDSTIKNPDRLDNLTTRICRMLTRVPNLILSYVTCRHSDDVSRPDFLSTFCQSFAIMSLFMKASMEEMDLVTRFLEFITLWYPTDKVDKLIKILSDENTVKIEDLKTIKHFYKNRKKASLKHMTSWANQNEVLHSIFDLASQMMEEEDMGNTIVYDRTTKITSNL